jgi:nicotinate-nucleotide pyrophosphorylase (carboxylating)
MKQAVNLVGGRLLVEASGNVTLDNIRAIAETGVDFISSGSITHSAPASDISMKIK